MLLSVVLKPTQSIGEPFFEITFDNNIVDVHHLLLKNMYFIDEYSLLTLIS